MAKKYFLTEKRKEKLERTLKFLIEFRNTLENEDFNLVELQKKYRVSPTLTALMGVERMFLKPTRYTYRWNTIEPNVIMAEKLLADEYNSKRDTRKKYEAKKEVEGETIERGDLTSNQFNIKMFISSLLMKLGNKAKSEFDIELSGMLKKYKLQETIVDTLVIRGLILKDYEGKTSTFIVNKKMDLSDGDIKMIEEENKRYEYIIAVNGQSHIPDDYIAREEMIVNHFKESLGKTYKEISEFLERDTKYVRNIHYAYLCKGIK